MLRSSLIYLSQQEKIKRVATGNPLTRRLATRFVAGETLAQGLDAVRQTNAEGMRATLDQLGENVTTHGKAGHAADEYSRAIRAIGEDQLDANISIKLSALGIDLNRDIAESLTRQVVSAAGAAGTFVRIDMEDSAHVEATLDITKAAFAEQPAVGTVIQSYLYRSAGDVRDLNRLGIRIRLVKGAYLEPASVAYPKKSDVDENFKHLAELLLTDGEFPAFATHDETIIEWIKDRALQLGRLANEWEFQMLYGVRRDLQKQLHNQGFGMRVYIPYGDEWYPYLMRRMAERPGNLLFIVGNVAKEARR
jgi:proline dehydrogenase